MESEEQRIFTGKLFDPSQPELKAIKLKSHNLSVEYNRLLEDETAQRNEIIDQLFGSIGQGSFLQGPIYIHYGQHTKIGDHFFGNFNLTIQDDAKVTIGNNCSFGPNVTIVTPIHPLVAEERLGVILPETQEKKFCYAKPVTIGDNCWLGANVVVCPGVTIGKNVVIGAGSVVTRDIPENSFAAGVPCKVIREITSEDSLYNRKELF